MNINEKAKEFAAEAGFPPNTPLFNDLVARLTEFVLLVQRQDEIRTSGSTSPIPRARLREDGMPTRSCLQSMTPAELAITDAMAAVEKAGASLALTEAVVLLGKARDRVADHVEGE